MDKQRKVELLLEYLDRLINLHSIDYDCRAEIDTIKFEIKATLLF